MYTSTDREGVDLFNYVFQHFWHWKTFFINTCDLHATSCVIHIWYSYISTRSDGGGSILLFISIVDIASASSIYCADFNIKVLFWITIVNAHEKSGKTKGVCQCFMNLTLTMALGS